MREPGWYPDPGGAQGRFRWWDGQQWSSESRDDPRSGLDEILDADSAERPAPPARILGYGTLSVALIAVVLGLATAAGAAFGRGPMALPGAASNPATIVPQTRHTTTPPAPSSAAATTSAVATATPSPSTPPTTPSVPEATITMGAPEEAAHNCPGVSEDATRLTDGGMSVQADGRWSREAVPGWLSCGQGGRLLAGEGTAQLWVGRVDHTPDSFESASTALLDQTLMQVGTFRMLSHEGRATTVTGHEGYQVDASVGGGQEPTHRITLVMLKNSPTSSSVIVSVTDADDGEGMRAAQEALGTLSTLNA